MLSLIATFRTLFSPLSLTSHLSIRLTKTVLTSPTSHNNSCEDVMQQKICLLFLKENKNVLALNVHLKVKILKIFSLLVMLQCQVSR